MNFRASFCDPFKPDIIELGDIPEDKIMETFIKIPWQDYIERMKTAKESEMYYSPSLEIENKDNRNGLSFSIISETEWYIFFKRPKLVKGFLGIGQKMKENYLSEIQGQTENDVRECITALLKNNLQFLENKIK